MPKINPNTVLDTNQDPGLSKKVFENKPKIKTVQHPLQWVKDKYDERDYIYVPAGNKLADKIDLRPYCTLVETQGPLGSCTGQAIAGAIELLNKRNRKPNDVAISDGEKRKVVRYERILDHDGCINALNNEYPITIGFYMYESFYKIGKDGIMPFPNTNREALMGGHAVLLVGYDLATERYIARNSWGAEWGDKGYFYMPFDVIKDKNMSDDFWIIKEVNNP